MNRGHAFLLSLFAVFGVVVFVIVRPFLEYILLALVFAYVLLPLQNRLVAVFRPYTPGRRIAESVSAITLIVASLVAIVLPVLYVLTALREDLREISRGESSIQMAPIEAQLAEFTDATIDLEQPVILATDWLFTLFFGDVPGLIAMLLHVSLGVALVLFLVFYLLVDGSSLVTWLTEASPLEPAVSATLVAQIDRTTWGAVIGHAFAAVVQALIAGLGFYLVGIPNVVFWTIVMVILAFLPLIGVFIVWAPAAGYLYIVGETSSAIFLAAYGLVVVSFIDYYVRPIVIDKQARLNPAVILVGVFGGVYTLGFVGLFVGPILIGVLVAIIETFRTQYRMEESAAEPERTESGAVVESFDEVADESPQTTR
ncbi:AI-2E family transporter [Salinadaptatus halalkaliphilus]|uniref:AI-2E family transporter n=1 Tax=Salinadaptatus halalkaliphilus TaxID=2419781 RepID=A0A4S3TTJ6_9EURY|nr:AI-2E family transporter [Salinadaptatus halalkaliphilus]THE66835.1 AI-2E family transporter [Salinadaptatus halalkaliphilus]